MRYQRFVWGLDGTRRMALVGWHSLGGTGTASAFREDEELAGSTGFASATHTALAKPGAPNFSGLTMHYGSAMSVSSYSTGTVRIDAGERYTRR
jgi:hypothetical protein